MGYRIAVTAEGDKAIPGYLVSSSPLYPPYLSTGSSRRWGLSSASKSEGPLCVIL